MTPSVSRRLNILCIGIKIIAFFIMTVFTQLYARVGILLTCKKHLNDRIISLSLTLPRFIEVPVPS